MRSGDIIEIHAVGCIVDSRLIHDPDNIVETMVKPVVSGNIRGIYVAIVWDRCTGIIKFHDFPFVRCGDLLAQLTTGLPCISALVSILKFH